MIKPDRQMMAIEFAGIGFTAAGACADAKRAFTKAARITTQGEPYAGYTQMLNTIYDTRETLEACENALYQAYRTEGDSDE